MKIKIILTGLALLSSVSVFAEGGNVSGGADYQIQMNAWFTTDQPDKAVRTCVESIEDFGYNRAVLKSVVQKTFEKWATYAAQVGTTAKTGEGCTFPPTEQMLIDYRVATRINILDHCDGSEDLTVYFGITNKDLMKRKKKYSFPFAFSELNQSVVLHSGSYQKPWSKGMIWIAPPSSVDPEVKSPLWTNYEGAILEVTLLHEMGHVFGNEHSDGTIMSGSIAHFLDEEAQVARSGRPRTSLNPRSLEIDQNRFLVYRPDLGFSLPLRADSSSCQQNDDDCRKAKKANEQYVYQRLTGIELVSDDFTAQIIHANQSSLYGSSGYLNQLPTDLFADIKIKLNAGGVQTELSFNPISILKTSNTYSAFVTFCHIGSPQIRYTLLGRLKRPDGTSRLFTLNINDENNWVNLVDNEIKASDEFCKKNEFFTGGACPVLKW